MNSLKIREVEDYPNALNGLHLENDGRVTRIGAAVDASEATIEMAIDGQVDLLIVHHGLFWGGLNRLVGAQFHKIKRAVSANLAIYSAHLPLDLHPEVGNNILLAQALELGRPEPFFLHKGRNLGFAVSTKIDRAELIGRLKGVLGRELWVCVAGPAEVRRVGIVTGGRRRSNRTSQSRRHRHVREWRRTAPHVRVGGRTAGESDLWRTLCHGDVWSAGTREEGRFPVWFALVFPGSPIGTIVERTPNAGVL